MTKQEVFELLKTINVYYERFEVNQIKIDAWYDAMKEYKFDHSLRNLNKYIKTSKFAPTIADLVEGQFKETRPYDNLMSPIVSDEELEVIKAEDEKFKEEHGVSMSEYYFKQIRENLSK